MTVEDVREYEKKMQEETNLKVLASVEAVGDGVTDEKEEGDEEEDQSGTKPNKDAASPSSGLPSPSSTASAATTNKPESDGATSPGASVAAGIRSWLTWS